MVVLSLAVRRLPRRPAIPGESHRLYPITTTRVLDRLGGQSLAVRCKLRIERVDGDTEDL